MAFFGNSGKRENPEMQQADANLRNAEAELQNRIFQLGCMYYLEHRNKEDLPENFKTMVDMIRSLDENWNNMLQRKLSYEGLMRCNVCGATIPHGSMFCNYCGKSTSEKPSDKVSWFTPQMAEPIQPSPQPAEPPVKPVQPQPASATPMESNPMPHPSMQPQSAPARNVCPHCGHPVEPENLFCTYCGFKLGS